MCSSYDFILDKVRFSYSSTNTFNTCPYGFKLGYIDMVSKENNFFANYGTLMHTCMEKFFRGELDSFELSQYYRDNYDSAIQVPAPSSPPGMAERYKLQGQEFFDNFSFNKENYDILLVEDKIDFPLNNLMFTARPDLVLKEKETGENVLFDYKSSAPFRVDKRTGREIVDNSKMEGYYKQMFTYTYALKNFRNLPIDKITIWFTRPERKVTIPWEQVREDEAIAWLGGMADKIKAEEKFPPCDTIKNSYFCNNLCNVRAHCEYR